MGLLLFRPVHGTQQGGKGMMGGGERYRRRGGERGGTQPSPPNGHRHQEGAGPHSSERGCEGELGKESFLPGVQRPFRRPAVQLSPCV